MKGIKGKIAKECEKRFKSIIIANADGQCDVCSSTFEVTAHHYVPRSLAGHMIYWLPNGVCLCRNCHFALHMKNDPMINNEIVRHRGKKWLSDIINKRYEKPKPSFKTLAWFQSQLAALE